MLLYLFQAFLTPILTLMTTFPRNFIIKDTAINKRILPSCPFPALVTPFLDKVFTNEEATDCINKEVIGAINEAAMGAIMAPRNSPSCFFISCFPVPVVPSINRPEYFSDFTILITSFISSLKMNKVNPFHALTAPLPLIFLSNLFIADGR